VRILSVGELLWDVIGDKEFLGGAPLNFSVASHRLGHEVAFLSGVGADRRGETAIQTLTALGLNPAFVQTIPGQLTGTAFVLTDPDGNPTFEIKRPAAFDFIDLDEAILHDLQQLRPEWIYFGTLAQNTLRGEAMLYRLADFLPGSRCFYDMNLRESHWSLDLVERLSRLASIIKLNETEAETLFRLCQCSGIYSVESFCRYWSSIYGTDVICVTLGRLGCAVWSDGILREFPGYSVKVADTIGAGDAFSAAFLNALQLGWPLDRVASFANAVGAIVASRPGATPAWEPAECLRLLDSTPLVRSPSARTAER
jgi:fructokinase